MEQTDGLASKIGHMSLNNCRFDRTTIDSCPAPNPFAKAIHHRELEKKMKLALFALAAALSGATLALGQIPVIDQPLFNTGGNLRMSQLWQDPSGQNDSDLDAILYEDFKLTQGATLARVSWIGDPSPSLGFRIAFYPQDPNSISLQPDIFRQGGGPFDEHDYPSVTQTPIGNNLYRLEAQLARPLDLLADTQYFIAIIGLTPQPFNTWRWAQGVGPGTGTFWWQRADGGRYYRVGDDRAMTLYGQVITPTLTISPDPLVAGQNATFTIDNTTPSTRAYLVYSLRGPGSTRVNQLNVTLDLAQPAQAGSPKTTNGNGHAVWNLPIPISGRGHNIWFQAAQYGVKTNAVATRMN